MRDFRARDAQPDEGIAVLIARRDERLVALSVGRQAEITILDKLLIFEMGSIVETVNFSRSAP
jgi:hypothetical protein